MSATESAALVGRTFGEFVVREPLSSGGFGLLFRAEQPALAREAVIKVLQTRHLASETSVQRFLREARLASKLDHPYAAHTYAFGAEPDGVLWIAMELVRGTPLDKLLAAQGPIPLARFVPLLDGICEVVHTAHEQGIVHRDLKPANVMVLSRAGRLLPKLLDFGIAKTSGVDPRAAAETVDPSLAATADESETPAPSDGRLTQDGVMIGSPLYMAPEQWVDAGTVDARTDLYALGVLAYECLTGRPPYTGNNRIALAMAHGRQQPPPLGEGLPPALDAVLARALAKKAADRYATALELAAAFRDASGIAAEPAAPPRLDDRVRAAVVANAPQPLAQAVTALEAARNTHQAQGALWQVVRVAVRLCGVTALAAHAHVGSGTSSLSDSGATADALRGLRRRTLGDGEWLELARELVRPFVAVRDAYPLPELITFLTGDGAATLAQLLAMRAEADGGASEEQVRELVARALPLVERVLAALDFFESYPLVVELDEVVTAWMGVRRADRPVVRVRGTMLVPGQPALIDAHGVPIVSLWPFAQVMPPAPGAPDTLFFFEGKGRRGARLVALPEAFEREDELLWEAFGSVLGHDAAALDSSSGEERAPFPGLAAFTAADAATFVGRERETEAFLNRLRVTPLLAVVGPSGAGKSSFVQAGVVPALPDGWTPITVRPGPAPLVSLAAKLDALGADAAELAGHPGALGTLLRTHARARGTTIVLIVDQLEELFTLCDDVAERALYAEALARAARSADDPVRVIATLRDDFLLEAEALAPLRARLGPGLQLLTTPGEPELLRILTVPVATAGYEFDDPALPGEMVAAVARTPGALALLSFTASKLWELRDRRFRQLGRKAYAAIGGVGGALAQHAEATLTAMPAEEQRLVREVFRHLVTAEGTRAVLSRGELDDVLGGGVHAAGVVEKLVAARLLVTSDPGEGAGAERIEVTHEALLDAWPRLLGWRREDAEGARLRDQLRAAARQWDERGRPSGLLWRGDALAEYRLWRARTSGALTAAEQAFAAASLADDARGRRRRTQLVGGAFVVLAAVAVALFFFARTAQRERSRAQASQADAEANAQKLHDRLEAQYEAQGRRLILDGDPLQGLAYLDKARELGAHGRAHDFLVAEALEQTSGELFEMRHGDAARTPSFSHDGTRILTASFDKTAKIWDARTGALLLTMPHASEVIFAKWSPDDRTVSTAGLDGAVSVWDAQSGRLVRELGRTGRVYCLQYSPDGAYILAAGADDHVRVWDASSGTPVITASSTDGGVSTCAYSPDGALIATGGRAGDARILDARTGAVRMNFHGHDQRVFSVRFSPDGTRLVTASLDGTAIVWDLASKRKLFAMPHHATVNSVMWSPDGRRIATSSNNRTASMWDAATGDKLFDLAGHTASVNRATFSPDGARLLTVGDDGVARLWDASDGRPLARWLGHRDQISDGAFDSTGTRVVTASEDGRVIVWDASPQEHVVRLVGHTGVVECATFAPDGAHVATAGTDGTVRLWDAASGHQLFVLAGHRGPVHWAAFSPDGRSLATGGEDGTIRVWDGATGALARSIGGHTASVNQLAWSHDGARILSVSDDGTLRAWSAISGQPELSIVAHEKSAVRTIVFEPDGARVVTTGDDGHVRTWDATNGEPRGDRSDREVAAVAFDPSGSRAASPIAKTIRIWNASDGKPMLELVGHVGEVTWPIAAWSPDGALLVSGALDGSARVWDAATGDMLAVYLHGRQVWTTSFSPDGTRILSAADDGTAEIRELPRVTPGAAGLSEVLRCRVPYQIDGDRAVARPIDTAGCFDTRSAR